MVRKRIKMIDIKTAQAFFKLRPFYRTNPVRFFEDILKFHPDEWQRNAAYDLGRVHIN